MSMSILTSNFHVGIHPGELDWTCLGCKNSFCLDGCWLGPTCLPHASPPQDFHLAVLRDRGVGELVCTEKRALATL